MTTREGSSPDVRLEEAEARALAAEARAEAAEARARAAEARAHAAESVAGATAFRSLTFEESLRREEAARTVTDVATWHWDIEQDLVYGDDNLTDLFGLPRTEAHRLGPFLERMHEADRPRVAEAIRQAVETGAAYDQEYRVVLPDGAVRWVHARGRVQMDTQGRARTFPGVAIDVTRRRLGEQRLREWEERYRTLVASLDQAFCILELIYDQGPVPVDARVVEANPAFERHTGIGDPVGRPLGVLDPRADPRRGAFLHHIWATGEPVRTETYSPSVARWVDLHAMRIGAPEERKIALLFSDISGRKLAEERLRESEARLRRALEASPFPTMIHADDGEVIAINTAWTQKSGYRAENLPTVEAWALLAYGERAPEMLARIGSIAAEARTMMHEGEQLIRTADGDTRTWDIFAGPLGSDPQGRRLTLRTASDVTERRRTEQALRESERRLAEREQRLRFALDATRTVTWEQPAGTDLITLSDTSRDVLGLPSTGTREAFLAFVHPGDRDAVREGFRRALAGEIPYEFEYRVTRPDTGEVRWFLDRGTVERDGGGRAVRARGLCTDVTARRAAEEQARAAQRMEAVGRLAGGVAHEINNALSGVVAFADLALRRMDPDDPNRKFIEQIAGAGDRAATVTRQLLAFGRRQILQLRDVDIAAVVHQFEPMVRQALGSDKLLAITADGPAVAHVDPVQIEQVLLNLVLNARDAMGYGGRLAITVGVRDDSALGPPEASTRRGAWVCIGVQDDGEGMSPDTLSHLFEPFFTTKPLGKGTGLGLSTVYGIVKQSNGHIQVESQPGRGTTFRIYLPCTANAAGVSPPLAAWPPRAAPVSAPPRSGRILVVDDEPIALRAVVASLESGGYTVDTAVSVADAEGHLARHPVPDLVITDLVMPNESGADLAQRLVGTCPEVPVLFISGYTGDEAIQRGLLPAGASFLQKPFPAESLLSRVGALLSPAGK